MKGNSDRTISLAEDDRARIPFAMIGVLLLVTSSGIVTYLETRPEPEPEVDTQLAMDRASASAQTAVSVGISEAADESATEPLTTTANTPVGRAIADTDTVIGGDEEKYDVFGPYVRLRIYLEAKRNLEGSQQRIDDDTVARASLPDVEYTEEGVEEAIDRVDLTVGRYDSELETGTVRATIDGVEVEVVRNGETIAQREESVTATTGTTVFELHERTSTYEERLQMDFYDSELTSIEGFGQRFGARVYPLAWGKAYTERMHPKSKPVPAASDSTKFAFHSVIENYETEALANSAIYAIQEDVYGAKDPQSTGPMRGAYACMAAKTGEKIYNGKKKAGGSSGGSDSETAESSSSVSDNGDGTKTYTNASGASFTMNAKQFCAATNYLFGDVEGESPSSVQGVVEGQVGGAQSPMEKEDTIPVRLFAEPAYQELTGGTMPTADEMHDQIGEENREDAEENASEATDDADTGDDYETDDYDFDSTEAAENQVDSIYRVEVSADRGAIGRSGGSLPDADEPENHSGWSKTGSSYDVTNREADVDHTELPDGSDGETLHEISITITNEYVEEAEWERTEEECEVVTPGPNETGTETEECYEVTRTESTSSDSKQLTFETSIVVEGDYDPAMLADEKSVANVYSDSGAPESTDNLEPAVDASVERLVNVDANSVEDDLASDLDPESITSSSDLRSQVDGQIDGSTTITSDDMLTASEKEELVTWLEDELGDQHTNVQGISISVKRKELIVGGSPLEPMRDAVDNRIAVEGGSGAYDTPAHVARANLVKQYRDGVHEWMDKFIEKRNDGHEQVSSDQLEDAGGDADEGIDSTLGFAQRSLTYNFDDNSADVDGSELHENVTFEIDASPTYLSRSPVTRATVNDVRPSYAGPESPQDADHAPMALRNQAWLPSPGLPLVPWPSYWYGSINNWDVDVKGEYARFEVTANTSDASSTRSTTYVRQEQPVTLDINDQERTVGTVDPIGFESETNVVVVTPGFTLYPRGSWGPGDRTGTGSKHRLSECTSTWDHAGTDFSPTQVNYADCPNVKNSSSVTFGSTELSAGADGEIEAEHSNVEFGVSGNGLDVDSEDDVEDGPAVDECNADVLESRVGGGRFDNLDLSDDEEEALADRYCTILPTEGHEGETYRGEFVDHLTHSDIGVAKSWAESSIESDVGANREALYYTTDLPEAHEIEEFKPASELNGPSSDWSQANAPSHREGIVTEFETGEEDTFARIYSKDGTITGGFLARPIDVRGKSRERLINDFALWDEAYVGAGGSAWGDYHCLGKVYVDDGATLRVSTTKGFSESTAAWGLEQSVQGGVRQFQYVNDDNMDGSYYADDRWVPLGNINDLNEDRSGDNLMDRWDEAGTGDNLVEGEPCGNEIYRD